MKDKSYEDEAEWRIVFYVEPQSGSLVKSRITNSLNILRYIEVTIPVSALQYIIVGPCADFEKVKALIEQELHDSGISVYTTKGFIKKSQVPYRIY